MLFFKSKNHSELDSIIRSLEMNKANNYKDNAQECYSDLRRRFEELESEGKLNSKQIANYQAIIDSYAHELKGYTHKDQTPYWT